MDHRQCKKYEKADVKEVGPTEANLEVRIVKRWWTEAVSKRRKANIAVELANASSRDEVRRF